MPRIVAIDDEKDVVGAIKEFLDARGFEVTPAFDGTTGLEVIKQEKPDLIILDILMPGLDGRDIVAKIKTDEELKHIPVIFLSAKDEIFDTDLGLGLGASRYLTKPFLMTKLIKEVKEVLNM